MEEPEKPPTANPPKPIPVAIQRLMDEVRDGIPRDAYDRAHMRHNRTGS
jgi:hypothetical protein